VEGGDVLGSVHLHRRRAAVPRVARAVLLEELREVAPLRAPDPEAYSGTRRAFENAKD
jgi:hypothetical protein